MSVVVKSLGAGVVVVLILVLVLTLIFGSSGNTRRRKKVTDVVPADALTAISKELETERESAEPVSIETKLDAEQSEAEQSVNDPSVKDPLETVLSDAALLDAEPPQEAREGNRRKSPPRYRPQNQPPKPSSMAIQLSTGTALAQTLPSGTAMGFSVDYEFVDGQPDKSAIYLWIIEKADGQSLKKPVQLGSQGTLMGFIPRLRPNQGPFHTHIEDQRGVRLSKSLPLR